MVDNYFRYTRNWDTNAKKKLIIKLTASIEAEKIEENDFASFYGAWDDNRTAEDIINELRADRVNSKEIENFE
jgi:hypothetical protein